MALIGVISSTVIGTRYDASELPENLLNTHSPLNFIQEQVQSDWIMLITSPWIEARIVGGPVETRRVTRWNRYGIWLATGKKQAVSLSCVALRWISSKSLADRINQTQMSTRGLSLVSRIWYFRDFVKSTSSEMASSRRFVCYIEAPYLRKFV